MYLLANYIKGKTTITLYGNNFKTIILLTAALIFEGNTFLLPSIVDRGGGVCGSYSSSLSFELSRSFLFCLQNNNMIVCYSQWQIDSFWFNLR